MAFVYRIRFGRNKHRNYSLAFIFHDPQCQQVSTDVEIYSFRYRDIYEYIMCMSGLAKYIAIAHIRVTHLTTVFK